MNVHLVGLHRAENWRSVELKISELNLSKQTLWRKSVGPILDLSEAKYPNIIRILIKLHAHTRQRQGEWKLYARTRETEKEKNHKVCSLSLL